MLQFYSAPGCNSLISPKTKQHVKNITNKVNFALKLSVNSNVTMDEQVIVTLSYSSMIFDIFTGGNTSRIGTQTTGSDARTVQSDFCASAKLWQVPALQSSRNAYKMSIIKKYLPFTCRHEPRIDVSTLKHCKEELTRSCTVRVRPKEHNGHLKVLQ